MKLRPPGVTFALAAVLCVAASGCRTTEPPPERDDLASARRAAVERRLDPRTFELLSRMAGLVVARERQLAQYGSVGKEYFRVFGATRDPRFAWAHEVECCVLLAGVPDPEPRMRKVARRMLEFEQSWEWANLAYFRELPRSDARLEAALIALRISTGWPEERIMMFDFDSLPFPDMEPAPAAPEKSVDECGMELLRATADLLKLAAKSPPPDKAVTDAALRRLREARIALAKCYLYREWKNLRAEESAAALAGWRIAKARCELEKSFSDF